MSSQTRRAPGASRSPLPDRRPGPRPGRRLRPSAEPLEGRSLLSLGAAATTVTAPWASRDPVDPATSMLVKFAPGTTPAQELSDLQAVGGRMARAYPDGPQVVELAPWADRNAALNALRADKSVSYAEADTTYHVNLAPLQPNDSLYAQQWGSTFIDAQWAWGLLSYTPPAGVTTRVVTKGGRKVRITVPLPTPAPQLIDPSTVVAVIDTGIDQRSPEFAGKLWVNPGASSPNHNVYGWNFVSNNGNTQDDNGHGTHVSGIIAAAGDNANGVAGVDWNARIMPLKTLDASGNGSTDTAVQAIYWAVLNGAKVINASWGGSEFSQAMSDAINFANSHGTVFVTAAGNDGTNNDVLPTYPASFRAPNELVVAAIDPNGQLASYSNYGRNTVDLAAPGTNVVSTVPGGYAAFTGTSMATPFVTGTVSLLASLHPELSAAQLVQLVRTTVKPLPSLAGRLFSGGVVDPFFALVGHQTVF